MFRDIGIQILVKWQIWKILIVIYPFVTIVGFCLIFLNANQAEQNGIQGNAQQTPIISHNLQEPFQQNIDKFLASQRQEVPLNYLFTQFQQLGLQTYIQDNQEQNIIARLKVSRSPNYECNLVTFMYGQQKTKNIALILSYIKILQRDDINYLSKDILFVGVNQKYQKYGQGIKTFLEEYHYPKQYSDMPRCGVIRQSLNIDLDDTFDQIVFKIYGINGRVPDRDFFLGTNIALAEIHPGFTYYEGDYSYLVYYERKIEYYVKQIWNMLFLNYVYKLPKHFISISLIFPNMFESIKGNLHDNHSYLIQYGIHSGTLRGISVSGNNQKLTTSVGLVLEAAQRTYMALDENLHMGSTLFIPVTKDTSITIQKSVLPGALILGSFVVPLCKEYIVGYFNNKTQYHILRGAVAMVILKEVLIILMGFSLVFIPLLTKILIEYIQIDYFILYWTLFFIIITIYTVAIKHTRKQLFNTSKLDSSLYPVYWQTKANLNVQFCNYFKGNILGLAVIYGSIVHIGIAYQLIMMFSLFMYSVQPLKPRPGFNKNSIPGYIGNLILIIYLLILAIYFGFDGINNIHQLIIDFNQVNIHLFYYFNISGVTLVYRYIDLLFL